MTKTASLISILDHKTGPVAMSPFEKRHVAIIAVEEPTLLDLADKFVVHDIAFETAVQVGKHPAAYDLLKPSARRLEDGTIEVQWDSLSSTGD